jgi:hypothetical protein
MATPFRGRIYVILTEVDGHSCIPHGVVACPARIKHHRVALNEIGRLYEQTVGCLGDEWNYSKFLDALSAQGYDLIDAAYYMD